jgi:hypothetical protein
MGNTRVLRPVIEIPSTDMHLPSVFNRVGCMKHEARRGQPCFRFYTEDDNGYERPHIGTCNERALKAGFVGEINPTSLDRTIKYDSKVKRA